MESEAQKVQERYARRTAGGSDDRYSVLNASVWQGMQERQRVLIQLMRIHAAKPLRDMSVLEVGCGSGGNLLELLRLGFAPSNLTGNELLSGRVMEARANLPVACKVFDGDATLLELEPGSLDVVYQSTVFTSILDQSFQSELARRMWQWVRPGGGILWYDFVYDNPRNPDVQGVPIKRIKALFPEGRLDVRRVTLAPPISRLVCKVHPSFYTLFNSLPWLRTHVLCWVSKPL
jgi:SAM-dependent methyltransferase